MTFKFEGKNFDEFRTMKFLKIENLIKNYGINLENANNKNDINFIGNKNENYNTKGFRISKSFEYEFLEN